MPFVQRVIEPKYLSKVSLFNEDGTPKVKDDELLAVTNFTLCNALRQLASISLVADDIFKELGVQLSSVYKRCEEARGRIAIVEEKVENFDPKKVPVPVGDICSFAQTKEHYAAKHPMDTNLFGVDTRPDTLKSLYESAAKTPVHAMRQLDRWRRDGHRSSRFFVCTPVLGARRRRIRGKVDIDIETRMPAVVEDLRRWTSEEALGDVTVGPNCMSKIIGALSDGEQTDGTMASDDEAIDHKLPSPEEQLQVVALRFPAQMVAVDVSGRNFDRMSMTRRSLMTGEVINRTTDGDAVRRRGRTRRPRNRRRNTLAGTDQKEIQDALTAGQETTSPDNTAQENRTTASATVPRSKSSDLLRSNSKKESPEVKISRFNSLKQWGKSQYDKFRNKSCEKSELSINSNKNKSQSSEDGLDDFNLYETVTMKRRRDLDKERKTHERNSSISSSEKSLPITSTGTLSSVMNIAVKLRDSSLQRRQRRQGNKDEPHSSSGNWSASSESGRASIGSEITSTTHPRSTTSAATSSNSLNHPPSSVNSRRRFNFNNSTSGSVTSEGSTLTPDIIHDLHEDGDSVYSCDTEGYYTSFHMDSGLKTLKEEELPATPLLSTSVFSPSGSNNTGLSAENEYELFGRGSTSTTTSSAGTVCTTLRAADSHRSLIIIGPAVPERKSSLSNKSNKSPESSLERDSSDKTGTVKRSPALSTAKPTVVAVIHKSCETSGDISPDSGHNTSSSPIESVASPNGVRSGSDFEFSESSDMEGAERIERIRVKTTINSSRIPSMCAITPANSDDESSSNSSYKKQITANNLRNNLESDKENGNLANHQRIITTNINGTQQMSLLNMDSQSGYVTVESIDQPDSRTVSATNIRASSPSGGSVTIIREPEVVTNKSQPIIKATLMPLNNMFGKLKTNITNFASRRDRSKSPGKVNHEAPLDDLGEYVTLADVRNNNEKYRAAEDNTYVNDMVNRNLETVLSGKIRDTEYVSLNELPLIENNNVFSISGIPEASSLERKHRQGARVMLDAEGKVVYSSDSLRRRKQPTSFEPGPFVKTSAQQSPLPSPQLLRNAASIRPVSNTQDQMKFNIPQIEFHRPLSPSSGNKVIIKASGAQPEIVRSPSNVVHPASPKMRPLNPKGAYVHVQAGGALSPKEYREGINPPSSPKSPTDPSQIHPNTMFRYAEHDPYFHPPQNYYNPATGNYYSTLPSKKTQYFNYDPQPERSVTPDITRGLERGGISSFKSDQNLLSMGHKIGIPVSMPQLDHRSPIRSQSPSCRSDIVQPEDSLKISPIDPRNSGSGFKSSTPSQIKAAENLGNKLLLSPKRSTMSNEELYAVIHKSKKKLNIEDDLSRAASPIREPESSTPKKISVETGYIGTRQNWSPSKGEYIDYNSDIDKFSPVNEPKARQSWACNDRKGTKKTSTLDFKRLLLQKSSTLSSNKKISAVEQLKLSKQQMQQPKDMPPNPRQQSNTNPRQQSNTNPNDMTILDLSSSPRSLVNRRMLNNPPGSPERGTIKPVPKILSPRSQWRFNSPRSDVLSSTIIEQDETSSNASRSSLEKRSLQSPRGSIGSNKSSPSAETKRSSLESLDNNREDKLNKNEDKMSTKSMTISERLSAQRAKFFAAKNDDSQKSSKIPPTLETSF